MSDYLVHHGIKGMRWGVRRFQNKDGSYTAAGKQRYGVQEHRRNGVGAQVGYSVGQGVGALAGLRASRTATANVINLIAAARNISSTEALASPLTTLGLMAAGYLTVQAGSIVGRTVGRAVGNAVDESKRRRSDRSERSERRGDKRRTAQRIALGVAATAAVAGIAYAAYRNQSSRRQLGEDTARMLEDNVLWVDFDIVDG